MQGTLRINNRVALSKLVLQKEMRDEGLSRPLRVERRIWKSILASLERSLCEGHEVAERARVVRAQGHEVTLGCAP